MDFLRRRLKFGSIVLFFAFCLSAAAQFTLDREPLGPSTRRTGLVISEIMYNPRPVPGVTDTNQTVEFIELYNTKPWGEDISGFRLTGSVAYVFPPQTVMAPKSFLVVARVPALVQSVYGITNVLGPWNNALTTRLPTEEGTVQLRNRHGAVLLQVDYQDSPPWPEAADGTGHSLNLVKPSWGENDFRAWAESDSVGGSPGAADPLTLDPLASVVINEWQNHSDPVDWVELYNHSNTNVDLSGAWLSDDPTTNKFRIPDGTILQARGFIAYDQNQLGFELFAGGETVFFVNSNQTRVIDVIDFRGQSNNISSGRFPDGGPLQYGLANRTQGAANSRPMRYGVVINEIMYNPISGSLDDEYVEIYNRSGQAVNLSAWEFVVGINYLFPSNMPPMPPGAYWVIARNPANLTNIYSNLNSNNTFGPYTGTLANGGERLLLAAADYDVVNNGVIERLQVPVSDLIYGDGGKWGNWSDGQGSSLELIDPEADEKHPSNWADSSDTAESIWTSIEYTGPVGETLGTPINDRLIIGLQGIGECLLDEVEVRVNNGPNLVENGSFEQGMSGWTLQGSHDFSTIENDAYVGTKSLHIRAGSRGDNQSNRILSAPLTQPIPADAQNVSIRAKARWFRGHPELLLRLHGSATEAYGRLALPRRLGSPGLPNSRLVSNAGPAVYEVKHTPILPAAGAPVIVTARARDPQGLNGVTLKYRVDPNPAYTEVVMKDNATDGDSIANDGIFSATIPAQPAGAMVAFYVEARDISNAIGTFPQGVFPAPGFDRCWPVDALVRECLVRWGEPQMPGDFATYHLWVSAVNSNRWHTRDTQNNTSVDGTFVYNNSRVMYNALPLYSGSPWHRTNATAGPAGPYRVDYEMNFPDDDGLLGSTDFVLNNPGNPNITNITDLSALAEQTVYEIFDGMGMPNNHRRYIHFFVNGSQRNMAYERSGNFIFEDSQQPNGDLIAEWFPEDAGGLLFKVEDWFEFDNNGFDISANNDADLSRRTVMVNGEETFQPGPYRYMFRKRSVNVGLSANDYSAIYQLIDAASPAHAPNSTNLDVEHFGAVADWEQWMRHFALHRAVGNWDSFGWERGKNDYLYFAPNSGWVHMPWDIDYSLGLGKPANEPLFASNDPRILAMFNTPAIVRAYWRAFSDLVNGPFRLDYLEPLIDKRAAALLANDIDIDLNAVDLIKQYIDERRNYLVSQLDTVAAPFSVQPLAFETTNNFLVISGTAPVSVKYISVHGQLYPVTWTSPTNFSLQLVLSAGLNNIDIQGVDRQGNPMPDTTQTVVATYLGVDPDPVGALVISEIMATPSQPGAGFIEIVNRSTHAFDLWNWRIDGLGFVFPVGSLVTNGQTVLIAQDRSSFIATYGPKPLLAESGQAAPRAALLTLVKPTPSEDVLVDGVRYEAAAPWGIPTAGQSLQLIDLAQDNTRPSNWGVSSATPSTPGAPNSVAATLPAYDSLWLNELQTESNNGPVDNGGELDPWIEIYNGGSTAINLNDYYLATNYTVSLPGWRLPAQTIAPGEFRVIWADGEESETSGAILHTPFRLDPSGRLGLVRLVEGQPQITDYMTWVAPGQDAAYGAFPDGQLLFRSFLSTPTPAVTNAGHATLYINEFMARNGGLAARDPADSDADDWFELYNPSLSFFDLGGYYVTDDSGDPTKYQVPDNGLYRVPPRGLMLVWADNEEAQNRPNRELHVPFALSGGSGYIGIFAPDGVTLVDSIEYGEQFQDISTGRYGDGASLWYSMTRPTPRGRNSVTNYNAAPTFGVLSNAFVLPGQTFTHMGARVTDPDGHTVVYSIDQSPPNCLVNPAGLFRWVVPGNQPPGEHQVIMRATDNGTPPKYGLGTFTITVLGNTVQPTLPQAPRFFAWGGTNGAPTFTFRSIPGRTYKVLYNNAVGTTNWTQLFKDFATANDLGSFTDPTATSNRFYQLMLLP